MKALHKHIHHFTKLYAIFFLFNILLAAERGLYANGYEANTAPHYTQTEWVYTFSGNNADISDNTLSATPISSHPFEVVFRYVAYHTQRETKITEKTTRNTFLSLKATQQIRAFLANTHSLQDTTSPFSLV